MEHLDAPLPNKSQETGQNKQFFHLLLVSYSQIIFAKLRQRFLGKEIIFKKKTNLKPTNKMIIKIKIKKKLKKKTPKTRKK